MVEPNIVHPEDFLAWFKGSRVKDDSSQPLIVYHGTGKLFEKFDLAHLRSNTAHCSALLGFYFSECLNVASIFTPNSGEKPMKQKDDGSWIWGRDFYPGAHIRPCLLRITNPHTMSAENFVHSFRGDSPKASAAAATNFRSSLINRGFDGILVMRDTLLVEQLGGDEYGAQNWVSFFPEQIRHLSETRWRPAKDLPERNEASRYRGPPAYHRTTYF